MITKDDLYARLNSIEDACQDEYYRYDEFEDCDVMVWDEYVANVEEMFDYCKTDEEREDVINSICVDDFIDWLMC